MSDYVECPHCYGPGFHGTCKDCGWDPEEALRIEIVSLRGTIAALASSPAPSLGPRCGKDVAMPGGMVKPCECPQGHPHLCWAAPTVATEDAAPRVGERSTDDARWMNPVYRAEAIKIAEGEARAAALEKAAQVCDRLAAEAERSGNFTAYDYTQDAADEIRDLASREDEGKGAKP